MCPVHDNPLDYFLKVMSPEIFLIGAHNYHEIEANPAIARKMLEERVAAFAKKVEDTRTELTYPHLQPTQLTIHNLNQLHYTPSWWTQFCILYRRSWTQHMRTIMQIVLRTIATVAVIMFGSFLYFRVIIVGDNLEIDVMERVHGGAEPAGGGVLRAGVLLHRGHTEHHPHLYLRVLHDDNSPGGERGVHTRTGQLHVQSVGLLCGTNNGGTAAELHLAADMLPLHVLALGVQRRSLVQRLRPLYHPAFYYR